MVNKILLRCLFSCLENAVFAPIKMYVSYNRMAILFAKLIKL